MKNKVNILGVNFDLIGISEAVGRIRLMVEKGGVHQIATFNPEYIVRAQEDKQLKRVIAKMDLIVPDGIAILWAAELFKFKEALKKKLHFKYNKSICQFPSLIRIRGGDLVEELSLLCAERGYKVALVGGEEGVAQKALLALQKKHPSLLGFTDRGPIFFRGINSKRLQGANQKLVEKIKKEKVKLLFTALSFKGPIWIDGLLERLKKEGVSLVACEVGGVFNYLAGKSKLPPKIVQKIGLEWLWRLVWEPWRIKRQLKLIKFLFLITFKP